MNLYVKIDYKIRNVTIEKSFWFFCIQQHGTEQYKELIITDVLFKLKFDISIYRSQGHYDAAVISEFYSGVQKRNKDKVPTVSYV